MNDSYQSAEKKVDDIVEAIERIGQTMIFNQSWQTLYEKEIEILKKQNSQMLLQIET